MRLATITTGNPQSGARPAIKSKSGKPLKKSPKKPSRSPETNHCPGCGEAGGTALPDAFKPYRTASRFS
jgi:hypothetical protein